MVCPHCRADNSGDSVHCKQCGTKLPGPDETQGIAADRTADETVAHLAHETPEPSARDSSTPRRPLDAPTWAPVTTSTSGISMQLEPGAVIGARYQIESILGEGGMGTVYKARDIELDRTVALKLVRPELALDPNTMQRFKQELLLASRISHKNILRIHDLGDANGVKFISMTYVEGEDLQSLMKRSGRLSSDQVVKFARQLCGALDAAHLEGVVHRDLKPQNILIDRSGTLYVGDFGLAKSFESEDGMKTRTGLILGTPRYMSPEQVEAKPTDGRSDIYSLGIILYEMVTGEAPFQGDSLVKVMYQRVAEPPKNPKSLCPDLPDYLAAIIMRCLERDPEKRYQTAQEILHDLEAEHAPQVTVEAEGTEETWSIPKPKNLGWLMAGCALLVVAMALAIPGSRESLLRWLPAHSSSGASQAKYIALLPFQTVGDDESLKYVAEGVVESLSAKLFQLPNVHLASSAAVDRTDKKQPVEKIARLLGVTYVVKGTLQGTAEKFSAVLDLENVPANHLVWSEEFSGMRQDLLTIEDQIYGKLVAALELKLSNDELARSVSRPTEDIDAYELYLKGQNVLRGQRNVANFTSALSMYDQAIKKDPRFALAYAGVADASRSMYELTKDSHWIQAAVGAAQQAQHLNDNLPEAHSSLGSAYLATGKLAEGIAELRRALELAPNSDEGYRRLASAYLDSGRRAEALEAFNKAINVNPYYWYNYNQLGAAYLRVGDNDKALEAFRRVTEIEPEISNGYLNLGIVYYQQGKWNECISAFQKAIARQPSFRAYSNLGVAYFYSGRYREAADMFEKAVAMNPNEQITVGNLADAYRWLGEREKAAATYDRAIALAYKAYQVNPTDAGTLASLALYYAKMGSRQQAFDFIRRARKIDPNNNALIYDEAVIHALAGQQAEAFTGLHEAFQKGYPPEEAKNDPELQALRSAPQFAKLLQEFHRAP